MTARSSDSRRWLVAPTSGVARNQSERPSGLVNSTQQVGTAVGIAILVAV